MIYRLHPTKDSVIANISASGNVGQNPILKVGKSIDGNGVYKVYRTLINFDIDRIKHLQSSGTIPWNTSSFETRLKLYDCYHSGAIPTSFDIKIFPITSFSWDEGRGIEEDFSQTGSVNWLTATSTQLWNWIGADYNTTYSVSQHFDTGSEDLDVDISTITNKWLDNTISNYGLILMLSSSQEPSGSGEDNYDTKMFYGRSTITNYEPQLEFKWDDTIKDDGATLVTFNPVFSSYNNYLYLYNTVNGILYDFPNVSTGSNTDIILTLSTGANTIYSATSSWKERGIWEAGPITGNNTGSDNSIYTASWDSDDGNFTIVQYYTASLQDFDRSTISNDEYIINPRNLKQIYKYNDNSIINLFIRLKYPVYTFGSGNEDLANSIMRNLYWEIKDAQSNETIIAAHPTYSKCSYDSSGNYFKFWASNLKRGKLYKFVYINELNRDYSEYDNSYIFKIE